MMTVMFALLELFIVHLMSLYGDSKEGTEDGDRQKDKLNVTYQCSWLDIVNSTHFLLN